MIVTSLVVAALAASAPPAAPPPDDPEGAFRAWAEREEVELSHTACDLEDGAVTCYGLDQYRTAVAAEWVDGDFALVLPIEPDPLPEDTVPSISAGGSPDVVSGEAQQIRTRERRTRIRREPERTRCATTCGAGSRKTSCAAPVRWRRTQARVSR